MHTVCINGFHNGDQEYSDIEDMIDGWSVYVRVTVPGVEPFLIIQNADFESYEDATTQAYVWSKRYNCSINEY